MKYFLILISALFIIPFYGCSEKNEDSETSTGEVEETEISQTYSINGFAQDGVCLDGGLVRIFPLSPANLSQNGEAYQTYTSDYGSYEIDSAITSQYVEVFADVNCYNEVTGGLMSTKTLSAIIDLDAGESNNITPLSTIRSPILRELHNDPSSDSYQDFYASRSSAEASILNFFNMPSLVSTFTDLSIEGDSTDDAVLVGVNSLLLYGRDEFTQMDFMSRISTALKNDASDDIATLKAEVVSNGENLSLVQVKLNLESSYAGLGRTVYSPPFWNLIDSDCDGTMNGEDPDSYVEILERDPIIQGSVNILDGTTARFDSDGFNWFAIPFIFDGSIGAAQYFSTNVNGDYLSIYSNKFDVYDLPDVEVLSIQRLRENYFGNTLTDATGDSISGLPNAFQGYIGGHSLVPGQKYWIVIHSDENYRPTFSGSGSGLVPFARKLASTDGINWIGSDQNTAWFRQRGIKAYWTD